MKLGFTLYNFHSVIKTLDDLDSVLARLEEMGVDTVQVSGIGHLSNYEVAKLCKKHNMEVINIIFLNILFLLIFVGFINSPNIIKIRLVLFIYLILILFKYILNCIYYYLKRRLFFVYYHFF